MKKLIIAAALILSAVSAKAQFGIVAGLNTTSYNIEDAYNEIVSQDVTNYHAGIVYNLNLLGGLSIQPGVVYNMKGAALSTMVETQKADITTSTGYLEIPLRAQYSLNLGLIAPFVFVEPYAGYAITTETKAEFENEASRIIAESLSGDKNLETSKGDENRWDGRDRLEYGVGAGAGIRILGKLAISARYYWDMGNMFTEDKQSSVSAEKMYEKMNNQKASGICASVTLYF